MEKIAKTITIVPSTSRVWRFVEGLVALALAGLLTARAFDTGSWQQYFLAAVFLGTAINRFIRTVQGANHGKHKN